jgi:hypothetical protein
MTSHPYQDSNIPNMTRFMTDDCDIGDEELCILLGGNGDYYVSIGTGGAYGRGVRLSTSGGATKRAPNLVLAIAELWRAGQENGPIEKGEGE